MMYLEWSNEYVLGISELDGHHMHLVDLLNRAYTVCMSYNTPDDLKRIVDELSDYVAYHFAAEEQVMAEQSYPGLAEQQQEHALFKQKLDTLHQQISNTASFSTIEAVELTQLLADWFRNHILTVDAKLGAYLNRA